MHEQISSDEFLIYRDIKNAFNEKSFKVFSFNDDGSKKNSFICSPVDFEAYIYYFTLWENYHFFGYPNNMNWIEVPEWFNSIIKRFQNAFVQVENLKAEKERRQ